MSVKVGKVRKVRNKKNVVRLSDMQVKGAENAVVACEVLHRRTGPSFLMSFKRKTVPMVLHRIAHDGHVFFVFQIAIIKDESMMFTGMQQTIGMSLANTNTNEKLGPPTPNDSYIGYIHAMPLYGWKGSDMVELALGIARALGVQRACLYDGTYKACDGDESGYDLSMVMLLSRQISFYGRYGFRPVVSSMWEYAFLPTGDPVSDMCKSIAALKRVRVSSFLQYIRSMLHVMDASPGQPKKPFRLVLNQTNHGVLHMYALSAATLASSLHDRIKLMKRLKEEFAKHPRATLMFPLFEGSLLSCTAKSDFLELLGLRYHTLRLGVKGNSPKRLNSDVQWPAWSHLSNLSKVRGLKWQAIVNQDPALQRVKTMC